MRPNDVILLKIGEEAAEVAESASQLTKQVMKAMRFGLPSNYMGKDNQRRVLEGYEAVVSEMFDLRVSLLVYNQYAIHKGASPQSEIDAFGLANFSTDEYLNITRRLVRYLDTLDETMSRCGLTWADASDFVMVINNLNAYLMGETISTVEPTP